MKMKDVCTWSSVPDDLILEGMWYIEIIDGPHNKIKFNDRDLDIYVKSVNIPFNSIEMEKTNFGMLYVKERNFPESVTITFNDSSDYPWLEKFQEWLDSIYSFEDNRVKGSWKNQQKKVVVNQVKIVNKKDISKAYTPIAGINSMVNAFKDVDLSEVEVCKIATYELISSYITKIENLDFSSDSSGAKEFSIELEFEEININYYNKNKVRTIN